MECKFLDSYEAQMDGATVEVWYCRKRDPFVLGASKEVALATCSSCRLSDYTRPPSELAIEVERRNQELVALNAIVWVVINSTDFFLLSFAVSLQLKRKEKQNAISNKMIYLFILIRFFKDNNVILCF